MYRPRHNDWTDRDAIVAFCKAHPFAMLVSVDATEARPVATHLPVIIHEVDGALTCTLHVARLNEQWKSIENQEVLLVFTGPHTYVSPREYEVLDVPTWNYIAVHLYGKVHVIDDAAGVRERLHMLVVEHDNEGLWQLLEESNLIDTQLRGIVMLEVQITDVQGKRKLGQARTPAPPPTQPSQA